MKLKKYSKDYLSKMSQVELLMALHELILQQDRASSEQVGKAVEYSLLAEFEIMQRMGSN